MPDSKPRFGGSMVAIVTPMRDGGADLDAFGALIEWHIASGTSAIVVAGTTGESATLRLFEREALCRRAVSVCAGRVPVVMGTGTNATWSSVEQTKAAAGEGADAFLVVTPYYNKPTQAGMIRHYEEVAKAAGGRPVIAYDVPARTAVTLAEETIHRLAEIPGIAALKDATGDAERLGRLAEATSLTLLSGDDSLTLRFMDKGAAGVISVAANVVPDAMVRLCAERDPALHDRLTPLFKALFVESNPIPVKFALARMGRIRNELRLPLLPLAPRHEPAVLDALASAGVLS